MCICDFSRSVGAGRATTRNTRGLTRSVIRLIVPPFPAVSRPSNTELGSGPATASRLGKGGSCLAARRTCLRGGPLHQPAPGASGDRTETTVRRSRSQGGPRMAAATPTRVLGLTLCRVPSCAPPFMHLTDTGSPAMSGFGRAARSERRSSPPGEAGSAVAPQDTG